jgi:hypothetical protein
MKLGTKTVEAATAVMSARYMVLLLLYVARQSECGANPKSLGVGGDVSSVQAVLRSRLSRHRSRGEISGPAFAWRGARWLGIHLRFLGPTTDMIRGLFRSMHLYRTL